MNFSRDCCFFLNLVHSSESKKKLDLGRNMRRTTITIISSMVFFLAMMSKPWFYFYMFMYSSVYSIHNKRYMYIYIYIHMCTSWYIQLVSNTKKPTFCWNNTWTTYVKRLDPYRRSHRSAVSSFPPTVGQPLFRRAPEIMGVWNLGDLGLSGKVECQAYIYPRVAQKKHMIHLWYHYTIPENSWISISPKKGGHFKEERIVFWNLLFFTGTCGCFLGVFLLGSS